ncbi:flagellar basal body rod protein FlgC [bacterium]|nr:flagellar basal body rod protein FlgC [bacterium]
MLKTFDVSRSALVAQRERMNVIAGNIAFANTPVDPNAPEQSFQRRYVEFFAKEEHGSDTGEVGYRVQTDHVSGTRIVHSPGDPRADENGNIHYPKIDMMNEFADAVLASRAYEANVATIQMTRQMTEQTLRLLQ